jgi:hypothetical protein
MGVTVPLAPRASRVMLDVMVALASRDPRDSMAPTDLLDVTAKLA